LRKKLFPLKVKRKVDDGLHNKNLMKPKTAKTLKRKIELTEEKNCLGFNL